METIYKIDMALILVSALLIMGAIGYVSPQVIAPLDDYETSETNVLFEISNADTLLIDDNMDFTTPDAYEIKDGLGIRLSPGTYYWKAVGVFKSEIRTLTINSEVNLELKKTENGYEVTNAGNVRLNVDVYNDTGVVDKIKLNVGDEVEVAGSKFAGGYDE